MNPTPTSKQAGDGQDDLPPMICGACGAEFWGNVAIIDLNQHMKKEHAEQDDASAHSATPTALGQQVANLDLCKELYALSGWEPIGGPAYSAMTGSIKYNVGMFRKAYIPAYTAGYLLRKLPASIYENDNWIELNNALDDDLWTAKYTDGLDLPNWDERLQKLRGIADTPESALALLACELIKQGVIQP